MQDVRAVLQQAIANHQQGRVSEAETLYRQVLAAQPDHPDTLHLLAIAVYQLNRVPEAMALVDRAIALNPSAGHYHTTRGNFFQGLHQVDEAIASYHRSLSINSNDSQAYSNLGNALARAGKIEEAIEALEKADALAPNTPAVLINLGSAFRQAKRSKEAIGVLRRAVALADKSFEAHANLANSLKEAGGFAESIYEFRRALTIRYVPEVESGLGSVLHEMAQGELAMQHYQHAAQMAPQDRALHANYITSLNHSDRVTPAEIFEAHRAWARAHADSLARQSHAGHDRDPDRRLKIGYISGDFRRHSVAYFYEPILSHHDHKRFEIFCYSDHRQVDDVTERLRASADHWVQIVGWSDDRVVEQVARDGIDILVDLAGHMAPNRLLVFARKAAPIQITYLGYPNTTGLAAMDYRITDAIADPISSDDAALHSERLLRPNPCFLCYRPVADAPDAVAAPSEVSGGFTFGSFNRLPKASATTLSLWSRILQSVPNSRLLLKSHGLADAPSQALLRALFQNQGIDPARVNLLDHESTTAQHLALYNQIDVALDTYPYNGTTTTCEALWMGVPVVTLRGRTHASRVGASLLTSLKLNHLIAGSTDEFIQHAIDLASDRDALASLRQTLRERMRASALLDATTFTRNLEASYRSVWSEFCRGLAFADAGL